MNLSLRMRASIAAGVVVVAGLVGCQTTLDYVDHRFSEMNLPRPNMPSFDDMVPFNGSRRRVHAEPYQPPKLEPVPDAQEPLILPAPASTNSPSQGTSRPVSSPPTLPPFEAETPVPSARLFPSGPVRKMGFETSSVIKDSNIIQTGCDAGCRRLVRAATRVHPPVVLLSVVHVSRHAVRAEVASRMNSSWKASW